MVPRHQALLALAAVFACLSSGEARLSNNIVSQCECGSCPGSECWARLLVMCDAVSTFVQVRTLAALSSH
jgi:hypothetical protein